MQKNLFCLKNKSVVVFGGAGYLGSVTTKRMLELGAQVLVADLFPLPQIVEELKSYENCVLEICDISKTQQIVHVYEKCVETFGQMSTVVNFAVQTPSYVDFSLEQTSDEDFDFSMRGIIGTSYRVIREAIPYLEKYQPSSIVNTSSMYGIVAPDPDIYGDSGQNNPVYYGPGKAGILQLTRYAAANLGRRGIRVNSVTPGTFPDPKKNPPENFKEKLAKKTMLGRVGVNEEIAGAYCYLISDAASFTTGSNIVVDGGWISW